MDRKLNVPLRKKFIHALIEIIFIEDRLCTGHSRPRGEFVHIPVLWGFTVKSNSRCELEIVIVGKWRCDHGTTET